MLKNILLVICVAIGMSSFAQYAGFKPLVDVAAFKQQFSAASQKTNAIQSDFAQEKNLSMLSEKISSQGKFWFKKENIVRIEYNKPFHYLMVINKGKVFIKDDQKSNTVSTKSNKIFQQVNKIIIDCVQGTALDNPDFKTKIFEGSNGYLVELMPNTKGLKDLFKNINVTVDKKDYSVSKLEMFEQSGDDTVIRFLNKQLNPSISDAVFALK